MNDFHHAIADIVQITPLTDSILRIHLKPKKYITYQAGQYLQIKFNSEWLSYSIANAPLGARFYELHIRHSSKNETSTHLLKELREHGKVEIRLPFGDCTYPLFIKCKHVLFITKGTGFAPAKSIIEQILAESNSVNFSLIWIANTKSDLYLEDKVIYWKKHVKNFKQYYGIEHSNYSSLLKKFLIKFKQDFSDMRILIGGNVDMVYHVKTFLKENGVNETSIFSDAFAFFVKEKK